MKITDINYEPLERLNNAYKTAFNQLYKNKKGAALLVFIIVLSIVLLFYYNGLALIPAGFILVQLGLRASKLQKQDWRDFAAVNGWEIIPENKELIPPGLKGIGHSQSMSEIIKANFEDTTSWFFKYQYTVGSGKNSQTYYFTIVRVDLGEPFPHIVLDAEGSTRDLKRYSGYQHLQLEGNFNKYFKLFIAPGSHIDVLSIITPDVMQTLIDANQKQDIEIINDGLFFIGMNDARSPKMFKILLDSVMRLTAEMKHRAKSLNYQPNQTQKQV